MLPKKQRLTRREFDALLRSGRRVSGTTLTVVYRPGAALKCGVVVGKKTARKAVARHLLRRRIFSILRGEQPLAPLHLAVLTRSAASTLSFEALTVELRTLLGRVRTEDRAQRP